jgi:hypothetical protein
MLYPGKSFNTVKLGIVFAWQKKILLSEGNFAICREVSFFFRFYKLEKIR